VTTAAGQGRVLALRRQAARAAVSVAPFAVALAVGAVVLAATGSQPLEVYALLFREAVGSQERIASTLSSATPLLFTGLATAIAFRAGVFSIGVEGSFFVGGLAAAWVGFTVAGLSGPALALLCALAGAACGGAWAFGPGLARARWGVDEVVTTLMLNFVAIGLTAYLVNRYLLAPGVANSATPLVEEAALLPRLLPPSTLNAGFLVALALVVAYGVWVRRSSLGYEFGMVGTNPDFCAAAGISVARVVLLSMVVSGAIGGLGGAAHVLGVVHRFTEGFSPGYGFTGIAVALLGRNSAVGIVLAAILFGALASAGSTVQLFSDVPLDIVNVLEGTVMIFAVVQLVRVYGQGGKA